MITSRTQLLQLNTPTGWKWVFCWVENRGRVETTDDYRKGLRGTSSNLDYFRNKGGEYRLISPKEFRTESLAGVKA